MKLPNCSVCKMKVEPGTGYVCVDDGYASFDYPKQYAAWKQGHINSGNITVEPIGEMWTGAALLDDTCPETAKWQVLHKDCDPRGEADDYWFGVERCHTYIELLDWTAHLMDKSWFENTDWPAFLRRIIAAQTVGVAQ